MGNLNSNVQVGHLLSVIFYGTIPCIITRKLHLVLNVKTRWNWHFCEVSLNWVELQQEVFCQFWHNLLILFCQWTWWTSFQKWNSFIIYTLMIWNLLDNNFRNSLNISGFKEINENMDCVDMGRSWVTSHWLGTRKELRWFKTMFQENRNWL